MPYRCCALSILLFSVTWASDPFLPSDNIFIDAERPSSIPPVSGVVIGKKITPLSGQGGAGFFIQTKTLPDVWSKTNDVFAGKMYLKMLEVADSYRDLPRIEKFPGYAPTIHDRCLENVLLTLALAARLVPPGENSPESRVSRAEGYRLAAKRLLMTDAGAVTLEESVGRNNALTVGGMATAYSIAYDLLAAGFSEAEKNLVLGRLRDYGTWLFDQSTGNGVATAAFGVDQIRRLAWNWNGVAHGGLGLAGLVLGEPGWVTRAADRTRGFFIYGHDLTGAPHEGIDYEAYGLNNSFLFAVALKNTTGIDLLSAGGPNLVNILGWITLNRVPVAEAARVESFNNGGGVPKPAGPYFYLCGSSSNREALWTLQSLFGGAGDGSYGHSKWGGHNCSVALSFLWHPESLMPRMPSPTMATALFARGQLAVRNHFGPDGFFATFQCAHQVPGIHNHGDQNAFTLHAYGDEFLIDPSGSTKSTEHNTVTANDILQQGEATSRAGDGWLSDFKEEGRFVSVTGHGAKSYRTPFERHDRRFTFARGDRPYVLLVDDMRLDGHPAVWTSRLQTPAANQVEVVSPREVRITGSRHGSLCRILMLNPPGVTCQVLETVKKGVKTVVFEAQGVEPKFVLLVMAQPRSAGVPGEIYPEGGQHLTVPYAAGKADRWHISQEPFTVERLPGKE